MNAAGGPAPEQTTANGSVLSNPLSKAREKARPEQYRKLRDFVKRSRKGLPALDPFVWWGRGEKIQLKKLGLERGKDGRIVNKEGAK